MLKKLDFTVYDTAAAASNHTRDFPLWIEAARLKEQGTPYSTEDLNKLTGHYNVIVADPANSFAADLVKAFPYAKVICLAPKTNVFPWLADWTDNVGAKHFNALGSVDPTFFGAAWEFACLKGYPLIDISALGVPKSKLLRISEISGWQQICSFLGAKVPNGPLPEFDPVDPFIAITSDRLSHLGHRLLERIALGSYAVVVCLGFSAATFILFQRILEYDNRCSSTSAILSFILSSAWFILSWGFNINIFSHLLSSIDTAWSAFKPNKTSSLRPTAKSFTPSNPNDKRDQRDRNRKWQPKKKYNKKYDRKYKDRTERPAQKPSVLREQADGAPWQGFQQEIRSDDVYAFVKREAEAAEYRHGDE